ncbi:hypothetical protein SKAU_G00229110 [Synaphobranchus kaupii]|uniref:Uncharacterized protein n=1 Tax=Synaphobranchus kaupii TaxID=118154 RepID=A0A9Q1F5H3_SYNKA|nr:hypothetical protein SKAU_G00229110 [Synaphobranchus kaupii]
MPALAFKGTLWCLATRNFGSWTRGPRHEVYGAAVQIMPAEMSELSSIWETEVFGTKQTEAQPLRGMFGCGVIGDDSPFWAVVLWARLCCGRASWLSGAEHFEGCIGTKVVLQQACSGKPVRGDPACRDGRR